MNHSSTLFQPVTTQSATQSEGVGVGAVSNSFSQLLRWHAETLPHFGCKLSWGHIHGSRSPLSQPDGQVDLHVVCFWHYTRVTTDDAVVASCPAGTNKVCVFPCALNELLAVHVHCHYGAQLYLSPRAVVLMVANPWGWWSRTWRCAICLLNWASTTTRLNYFDDDIRSLRSAGARLLDLHAYQIWARVRFSALFCPPPKTGKQEEAPFSLRDSRLCETVVIFPFEMHSLPARPRWLPCHAIVWCPRHVPSWIEHRWRILHYTTWICRWLASEWTTWCKLSLNAFKVFECFRQVRPYKFCAEPWQTHSGWSR